MLSYSCTLLACLVSSLLPLTADPALGEDRGTFNTPSSDVQGAATVATGRNPLEMLTGSY